MQQTTCGALTLRSTVSLSFSFFNLYLLLQFSDVLVKCNTVQPSSQPSLRTPLCLFRIRRLFSQTCFSSAFVWGAKQYMQEPAGTWGLLYKSCYVKVHTAHWAFFPTLFNATLWNRVSLKCFCRPQICDFFFLNLSPLSSWDDRQACTSLCLVKSFILWSDAILFHTGNLDRISNCHSALGLVGTGLTPRLYLLTWLTCS